MRGDRDFVDIEERQCGSKKAYPSKAVAKRRARIAATQALGEILRPYRCHYCGMWHLGHDRPKGWRQAS